MIGLVAASVLALPALGSEKKPVDCPFVVVRRRILALPQVYKTSDYPRSGAVSSRDPGPEDLEYARWASRMTTEVHAQLARGQEPEKILSELAVRRREFQEILDRGKPDAPTADFGASRLELPDSTRAHSYLGFGRNTPADNIEFFKGHPFFKAMLESPLRRGLVERVEKMGFPESSVMPLPHLSGRRFAKVESRFTKHRFLDGSEIDATQVIRVQEGHYRGDLLFLHPPASVARKILADVWARFKIIRRSASPDERATQLPAAIEGFFQAMPYRRGSASIGQIFWNAAGSRALNQKLILPDGVDMDAMIRGGDFEWRR